MAQNEKNYSEQYIPSVNGEVQDSEEVKVTVVDNGNGTVNVTFRDFVLHVYGADVPISKVDFTDIPTTTGEDGVKHFSKNGTFTPEIPDDYKTILGIIDLTKFVNNLPYTIEGKMNDNKFYAVLDFDVKISVILVVNIDDHYSFEIGNESLKDVKMYNEELLVTINGETSAPQNADVAVEENADGTINFVLKNFILVSGEESMPVGTISVKNITVQEGADGVKSFAFDGKIIIENGDQEGVDAWFGPSLQEIPIVLNGKLNNRKLFATINIVMEQLGQTILVQLGNEDFNIVPGETKTYKEPLVVSVNGEASAPTTANVDVTPKSDKTIDIVLQDFSLQLPLLGQLPLGDFTINDVPTTLGQDGLTYFNSQTAVTIPVDQLPAELQNMADNFKNIPVTINGKLNDKNFYAVITMTIVGQSFSIVIGNENFSDEEAGNEKLYVEPLVVTVNGQTSELQTANVVVTTNEDGTINFTLKNFTLKSIGSSMPVGNIFVENIPVTEDADGLKTFSYTGNIVIQDGDKEGVEMWMGPHLGEIPLVLNGQLNDEHLFATIDIELTAYGQTIHVQVGTDLTGPVVDEQGNRIYTEQLLVTVNGETSDPQFAKIVVADNGNGTMNFILKNFCLISEESTVPVGTIVVENITVKNVGGVKTFSYNGPITITAGDKEGVAEEDWIGPKLGDIPAELKGKLDDTKLYATIDINLASFIQLIHVQVGADEFPGSIIPTTYNEPFYVTVAESTVGPNNAVVNIYDKGNKIDFELKDFVLGINDSVSIPFGNLVLEDLDVTDGNDGMRHFSGDRSVNLSVPTKDLPEIVQQLVSLIGGLNLTIPITIEGRFNEKHVLAEFDVKVSIQGLGDYSAHVSLGSEDDDKIEGDLNGDSKVDIADAVAVLEVMARDGNDPEADLNGDGKVDIADFVAVLEIMAKQ